MTVTELLAECFCSDGVLSKQNCMNSGRVASNCFMSSRLMLDLFNCCRSRCSRSAYRAGEMSRSFCTQFNSLLGAKVSSVGSMDAPLFILC
jgi:hypothetical protein